MISNAIRLAVESVDIIRKRIRRNIRNCELRVYCIRCVRVISNTISALGMLQPEVFAGYLEIELTSGSLAYGESHLTAAVKSCVIAARVRNVHLLFADQGIDVELTGPIVPCFLKEPFRSVSIIINFNESFAAVQYI